MPLFLPGPGSYIGLGEPIGEAATSPASAFLPQPLRLTLAKPPLLRPPARTLRQPGVITPVNPNFQTGPWIQLSQRHRGTISAHSYRQPVILTPAAPFLPRPLRLALAKQARPTLAVSAFRPKTVLGLGWQVAARYQLAAFPRSVYRLRATSRVSQPTLPVPSVAFVLLPPRVTLAKQLAVRPLVQVGPVAAVVVNPAPPPLLVARRTTLAQFPGRLAQAKTRLRPPITVIPAPLARQVQARFALAAFRRVPRAASRFPGPTVVSTPTVPSLPVRPSLHLAAWAPTRLRLAGSSFRPPTIIGSAIAGWTIAARYQLVAFPRPLYRTGLGSPRAPIIIDLPPAAVGWQISARYQLSAFPRRLQVRPGLSWRRGPTVVGPFATPTLRNRTITVTLARRQWAIQPTHARRAPAVIGAAPTTPPATGVNQDFAAIISGW